MRRIQSIPDLGHIEKHCPKSKMGLTLDFEMNLGS